MRLVVVDDDQIVAISLKTILEADEEIDVVACGNDGEDAIMLYEREKPDILLMDIQMKNVSGLSAAEEIMKKDSDAKILLLTTFSDDEYIVKALDIGVKGYILKQDLDGIVTAVKAVFRGQSVFGGEIVSKIPVLSSAKAEFDFAAYDIGQKEQEVMAQVALGKSNREIAETLLEGRTVILNFEGLDLDIAQRIIDFTSGATFSIDGT